MIEIGREVTIGYPWDVRIVACLIAAGAFIAVGLAALELFKLKREYAVTLVLAIIAMIASFVIFLKAPREEQIKCVITGEINWNEFIRDYDIIDYHNGIFRVIERAKKS